MYWVGNAFAAAAVAHVGVAFHVEGGHLGLISCLAAVVVVGIAEGSHLEELLGSVGIVAEALLEEVVETAALACYAFGADHAFAVVPASEGVDLAGTAEEVHRAVASENAVLAFAAPAFACVGLASEAVAGLALAGLVLGADPAFGVDPAWAVLVLEAVLA